MKVLKALSAAMLAAVICSAEAVIAAPRMVLEETTFNFGYVPQNAKISHDFWLFSKGEDSLLILKVVPG